MRIQWFTVFAVAVIVYLLLSLLVYPGWVWRLNA